MSLTVVVTGRRGVGKTQLIQELSRSGLALPRSQGAVEDDSQQEDVEDPNAVSLQVANKYFNVALRLREVPLKNSDALEELCFDNSNVAGAIVVAGARDSPNSVDWSIFSPKLAFRLLVCRTGGDFEAEGDGEKKTGGGNKGSLKKARNQKTQLWYDKCLANGFEFIDYDWIEEGEGDFTPRAGVEKFGLLSEDVEGSERVVQVLHGSNYQDFQRLEASTTTGDGASSSLVSPITRGGSILESNPNTVLVLAVDVDVAENLLVRAFPDLKKIGSSNQSTTKAPTSAAQAARGGSGLTPQEKQQAVSQLSGTTFKATLDNQYFALKESLQFRVVSSFHLSTTMRDLLILGRQCYVGLLVLVAGRDHLPQLAGHVETLKKADLLKSQCADSERYLIVDSVQCPSSPLLSQWSDNNGFELVEVAQGDNGTFYDAELGFQGLGRLQEVLNLMPWDLNATGCTRKPLGGGSKKESTTTEAEKKDTPYVEGPGPETGVVVLSLTSDSTFVQAAFKSAFQGASVLKGVDFPESGRSARMQLETKYYTKEVPLFYHHVPSMATARQLYSKYSNAHTLLLFVDTKSQASVNMAHTTCMELLLTDRLQLPEGDEPERDLVTAIVANAAPTEGDEEEEEGNDDTEKGAWDAKFSGSFEEGWFVELVDGKGEPERLRSLIESTDWSAVTAAGTRKQLKGTAASGSSKPTAPPAIDWDKVHGCQPPEGFVMDPITLQTAPLPSKMKFEDLTKRIDLVKKHGALLPPEERKRQAAYLALKMGEAVEEG